MKVTELHTYDGKFKRYEPELGFTISELFAPQTRLPGLD